MEQTESTNVPEIPLSIMFQHCLGANISHTILDSPLLIQKEATLG